MTAINFQKRFKPMILNGSKTHTIRRRRKHTIKSGDQLQLYTGMRTKQCELIKETKCTDVIPIIITPNTGIVSIDRFILSDKALEEFAISDGFPSVQEFFEFFRIYPMYILLLEMEVIYWSNE